MNIPTTVNTLPAHPAKGSKSVLGGVCPLVAARHGDITVPGDPATVEDVEDDPGVPIPSKLHVSSTKCTG